MFWDGNAKNINVQLLIIRPRMYESLPMLLMRITTFLTTHPHQICSNKVSQFQTITSLYWVNILIIYLLIRYCSVRLFWSTVVMPQTFCCGRIDWLVWCPPTPALSKRQAQRARKRVNQWIDLSQNHLHHCPLQVSVHTISFTDSCSWASLGGCTWSYCKDKH